MNHRTITSADGIRLSACYQGPEQGPKVILAHGGGQTRHSWSAAATALSKRGYRAITFDARGHGDSDWAPRASYTLRYHAADLAAVIGRDRTPVILVGASMGGFSSLYFAATRRASISALVLVDIVPKPETDAVRRVLHFMSAHLGGFASIKEAAAAVAEYNPHRAAAKSVDGLRQNLRERNGRFYWHWDPAIITPPGLQIAEEAAAALRNLPTPLDVPVLLMRGTLSDMIGTEGIKDLLAYFPDAEIFDVAGAGHMVAGDRNDLFNAKIIEFLEGLKAES